MKQKILSLGIIIIYIALSCVPFLWHHDISTYRNIGSGDYISPIAVRHNLFERLFALDPFVYGGIDASFLIAHAFPFYSFFLFFELFNLSPSVISILLISAIILVSEISMYFYILDFLAKKVTFSKFTAYSVSFFAGILYGFSPYIIGLIPPGHMLLLISYAFFPFMLLCFEGLFLVNQKYPKYILLLFLIFLFCSSAFANIGVVYVILVVLGAYTGINILLGVVSIKKGIISLLIASTTIFLSNAWWMLPFAYTLSRTIRVNEASSVITNSIGQATSVAHPANLFFGRAEYFLYTNNLYLPFITNTGIILFSILGIGFAVAAIKHRKNKYILVTLLMLLLGIFITKGDQPPFGGLFLFLYNHIPGFAIFRRPVSKFYWVFLFYFTLISSMGFATIIEYYKDKTYLRNFCLLVLFIVSGSFVYLFARTPALKVFNIPNYYNDAARYLQNQQVNKIVLLPGFFGISPIYNSSLNDYGGVDFLEYIWHFPTLVPDSTHYSIEDYYKKPTNELVNLIREKKSICNATKNLGVTHILVREDVWPNAIVEDSPKNLIKLLDVNPDIVGRKEFSNKVYKGFIIYTLSNKCTNKLVEADNADVNFKILNPVKVQVSISHIKKPINLQLFYNFNKSWKIYPSVKEKSAEKNSNIINNPVYFQLEDLLFPFQRSFFDGSHHVESNFSNGWIVDPGYITKNLSSSYYSINSDGSINASFVLYFIPQSFFYYGIVITALTAVLLLIWKIKLSVKNN